jgi:FkbM family methyltransferase
MSSTVKETTVHDGIRIFCLSEREAKFTYQEVQEYLKNGITLNQGDVVFDVGANIGIFSLWVSQHLNNDVTIYAFEPIPAIFEVLRRNALRFNPNHIKLFPCGLSNESKSLSFTFFPNATMISSAYPDFSEQTRSKFKDLVLRNSKDTFPPFLAWLRWVPAFLRPLMLDQVIKSASKAEQVTCQVKTLSEIIREEHIETIDLLKIDVERSELNVLQGIDPQDWAKIRQIFVEVDDWSASGDEIVTLLKQHGFHNITMEQEPWRKGSKMFTLYALR